MKTPSELFDLSGRIALVTGARTGLGRTMADVLAAAGADIVGLGSQPMPETAEDVKRSGRRFHQVLHDLRRTKGFTELIQEVEAAIGGIDILVNNAGIIRRAHLLDFGEKDWDEVMDINLKSLFFLSQAVVRSMVKRKVAGRIINVGSLLSFQGGIRVPSYTASKHGVVGLTRLMANDLAVHGITVNAIAPGYMETDNTIALRADPDRSQQILARIPAGRWGRPEDVRTVVLFLASPASSYVTGCTVSVDGGWLAR